MVSGLVLASAMAQASGYRMALDSAPASDYLSVPELDSASDSAMDLESDSASVALVAPEQPDSALSPDLILRCPLPPECVAVNGVFWQRCALA
jgi:hypothetical protein